jgi:hypothetical protein
MKSGKKEAYVLPDSDKKKISEEIRLNLTSFDKLAETFNTSQAVFVRGQKNKFDTVKQDITTEDIPSILSDTAGNTYDYRGEKKRPIDWIHIKKDVVCKAVVHNVTRAEMTQDAEKAFYGGESEVHFAKIKQTVRLNFAKQEYDRIQRRLNLPDNALRMIQLVEMYQSKFESLAPEDYKNIITDLMSAKAEDRAVEVFNRLPKKAFTSAQVEQLRLASLTNEALLKKANEVCDTYSRTSDHDSRYKSFEREKEKYCREVEGRLLRSEIDPSKKRDIEEKLGLREENRFDQENMQSTFDWTEEGQKSKFTWDEADEKVKYPHLIRELYQDFSTQSEIMYGRLSPSKEDEPKHGKEKSELLQPVLKEWKKPDIKSGSYSQNLLNLRNNFLQLEKKIPEIAAGMKKDRRPWLSNIHAVFVALGCLTIVGLIPTAVAMYKSKQYKGTVMFTHAPETSKIAPAAEKALDKLGRIKKS